MEEDSSSLQTLAQRAAAQDDPCKSDFGTPRQWVAGFILFAASTGLMVWASNLLVDKHYGSSVLVAALSAVVLTAFTKWQFGNGLAWCVGILGFLAAVGFLFAGWHDQADIAWNTPREEVVTVSQVYQPERSQTGVTDPAAPWAVRTNTGQVIWLDPGSFNGMYYPISSQAAGKSMRCQLTRLTVHGDDVGAHPARSNGVHATAGTSLHPDPCLT